MSKRNPKTEVPKMTGRSGFKNTDHGPGWISAIAVAIKSGSPTNIYRQIFYHGQSPHFQPSDVSAPIEPRPSSEPISEPTDVGGVDDLRREIDPNANVPIHPSMKR